MLKVIAYINWLQVNWVLLAKRRHMAFELRPNLNSAIEMSQMPCFFLIQNESFDTPPRLNRSQMGVMEPRHFPMHPLCWHTSQPRRTHFPCQIGQLGLMDARAGGVAAADGQFACPRCLRGPNARRLSAAADRLGAGDVHPGQIRAEEICGPRMATTVAGQSELGQGNRRRIGEAEAEEEGPERVRRHNHRHTKNQCFVQIDTDTGAVAETDSKCHTKVLTLTTATHG